MSIPKGSAQATAFKTAIAANTFVLTATEDPSSIGGSFVGTAINAIPPAGHSEEGAQAIANFYNEPFASTFWVFNSKIPAVVIGNTILLAKYTIVTSIPPDTTQLYMNCAEACIAKGIVLQNWLLIVQAAGGNFDASQITLRQGLKDATSNIPSGTPLTTLVDGGWTTSLDLIPGPLVRQATNVEQLFAVATTGPLAAGTGALGSGGAQGTANVALAVYDGSQTGGLTFQDVFNAWGS